MSNNKTFSNIVLVFLAVVFVALGVILIKILAEPADTADDKSSSSVASVSSSANVQSEVTSIDVSSESVTSKEQIDVNSWQLRLVNSKNRLDEDFSVTTAVIKDEFAAYDSMKFDARAIDSLHDMFKAAKQDGITLSVISSYRTVARQTTLYKNKINYYLDKGYGQAEAEAEAATVVAVPGTSEHNLGLAIDINSVEQNFDETKEYRWLEKNAAKYGFVLRYPKSKEEITGIIYEPWHYRYVGVGAAKQMNDLGMCLEEYVEYLKK